MLQVNPYPPLSLHPTRCLTKTIDPQEEQLHPKLGVSISTCEHDNSVQTLHSQLDRPDSNEGPCVEALLKYSPRGVPPTGDFLALSGFPVQNVARLMP